ncbi:MAG: DNA-binding protein [Xenococcus sp. (in: cyanobacteria)]
MRRKIIGIMGSGTNSWAEFTIPLAEWIAQQNYHLLTGSGTGVMATASKAFCQVENRQGSCIGIVPTEPDQTLGFVPKKNYPNPWVEIPIITPLSTFGGDDPNQISRNHICVLSSDVIVALPGNKGTHNEVSLAIRFQKPIILLGAEKELQNFPSSITKTDSLEKVKDFILHFTD